MKIEGILPTEDKNMKIEGILPTEDKILWYDAKLQPEEMNFLKDAMMKPNNRDWRSELAGNIFRSELLEDKDNWFYETALKHLTERMFYNDWNNYRKYHIVKKEPLPKFELRSLWVNYQRQNEFNPLHGHTCLYTFVIFMKIPTHWKEQHALPVSANSNAPVASDFSFVWTEKNSDMLFPINFSLSPEDEGTMLFFPGTLKHQVYPFYGTEEERITISGNIILVDPNKQQMEEQEMSVGEQNEYFYEKKIKILQNNIRIMKKELDGLEKTWGKRGVELNGD